MSWLQITWFWIVLLLLAVYAILDGFDLGAGIFSLFTKKDEDKRAILSAIGPFWDGNEVWLLTGGGAIFAAFPFVYATVFSGFYLALMFVLFALIFRAVSIEFRNKHESQRWRLFWDLGFGLGSLIPALLFGVAIGNIIRGIPLNEEMDYTGTFFTLLNPYSLTIGLFGLAMFASHGGSFIAARSDGELSYRARRFSRFAAVIQAILFIEIMASTYAWHPSILANFMKYPVLWLLPIIAFSAMIVSCISGMFRVSSLGIVSVFAMIGAALYPRIVPSLDNDAYTLTISNSSSSPLTLKAMFIIALIGMPFVIGYTIWNYYTFRK